MNIFVEGRAIAYPKELIATINMLSLLISELNPNSSNSGFSGFWDVLSWDPKLYRLLSDQLCSNYMSALYEPLN